MSRLPSVTRCYSFDISAHQQTPIPPPRPAVLSHSISELKIDQPILTRCCSYAVGRTTRRHPATSSRIFFPLQFCSRHVHVITCPLPNIVYACCSSSLRKTFSFCLTISCSQNHAINSLLLF